ncbi:glutathione S-transferase family protein [Azospirillum sp.]|uniref:glutathione S-transferase family protein n=1 Tax=Azospirillum sp. TaxID=34012 RepID=UPI002D2E457D|nr:glutathione S-transferase family protein [Azospirillum sp.]HYD65286.1 glutathione S-transferase family protein [Azospirillum sp.]
MIVLHQFPRAWGINPSPFCLKVETYLRLAGLPYRAVTSASFRAPKRKLPYIVGDGVEDGRVVADSGFIIDHLRAVHGDPLDRELTAEQRALGHLMRRTCEESLYFAMVYARWIEDAGWRIIEDAFFKRMPAPVRAILPGIVRRSVRRSLHGQGYGRHARDEVFALGVADLDALAVLMKERPFAVANRPSSADATLYAFLVSVMRVPFDDPLTRRARACATFAAYLERMDTELAKAGKPELVG